MLAQCDSAVLQDMFDTQAWLRGEYESTFSTSLDLCVRSHGSDHWCCHLCGIKVAQEVGPQPQEAELLKMLVVILVHANRSVT
jgi:hypothetical protein